MLLLPEKHLSSNQPTTAVMVSTPASAAGFGHPTSNPTSTSSLTLGDLWRRLWRQKWLFLLTLLSVLALTAWVTWSIQPMYRSGSTIQIEKEGAQVVDFGNVQKTSPDLGETDPFFRTQYEQLKSRYLAERVIEKLDLERELFQPEAKKGFFAFAAQLKGYFSTGITIVKHWLQNTFPTVFKPEPVVPAKPTDYAAMFLKNLYVEPIEKTHLVRIFYESPDAELSANIVNTLINTFILEIINQQSETDNYAQTFLNRELEKARERLTNSENSLVGYARDNGILEVNNSQGTQEKKLEELYSSLAAAERRRIEADSQLNQARSHGNVAGVLGNPVVESLKRQLIDLEAEYQNQAQIFKPAYPDMQRLAQQINTVRASLAREEGRVKQSLAAEQTAAKRLEGQIRSELNNYKSELATLRDRSVEYNALKREVETSRKLYDDLLQRMNEVNVAARVTTSNVRIVDKAIPAVEPFRPNKRLNLLIGLLSGTMLASALALLRETLRRTVSSNSELQQMSGLPILGSIPHMKRMGEGALALVTAQAPGSQMAEAYRLAAANLKFALPHGFPQILVLTSVNPAEGKSTSSANLALSYAQMGAKVLLIDGDLRRPTLHSKLGISNQRGLSDYTEGSADLSKVTQVLPEVKQAYVITAGSLQVDPLKVLGSAKLSQLLRLAKQHFDVTIIDAPPLTGFADALVLASQADSTVLVADSEKIDRKQLMENLTQLQRVKQNVIGFLMVRAKEGVADTRYYARYQPSYTATRTEPAVAGLNLVKTR